MVMISLLCPSRGRPQKMFDTIQNWLSTRGWHNLEIILSLDEDDPKIKEYWDLFEPINVIRIKRRNRSAVDAINHAARHSTGDILIVVSDDFQSYPDWDKKLVELTQDKTDWIAKTPDGIQSWLITIPIMDRTYYNRFGYIYHPDYAHMFCDTELTCVADLTGRKITLDIPFTHNHYSTGRSQKDEVSVKADKTWDQGQALFIERAKRNFDLKEVTSKIMSPDYVNWMRSKGIKA